MKSGTTLTMPLVSEETSAADSPVPIVSGSIFSIFNRSLHTKANFPCDESVHQFIRKNFPKTSVNDWNSWTWQIKNSIQTAERLKEIFGEKYDNVISSLPENHLPFRITPYFASLLSRLAPGHPLFRTMIPAKEELIIGAGEKNDPLNEAKDTPVPHIVHRYPDRVLFTVTGVCAAYCRY